MCMDVERVFLDVHARGTGYKVLFYPGISPHRLTEWDIGVWVEAEMTCKTDNAYGVPRTPQGIYLFQNKEHATKYAKSAWLLDSIIATMEWDGLLARGVDGPNGLSTMLPVFTVLRARLVEFQSLHQVERELVGVENVPVVQ